MHETPQSSPPQMGQGQSLAAKPSRALLGSPSWPSQSQSEQMYSPLGSSASLTQRWWNHRSHLPQHTPQSVLWQVGHGASGGGLSITGETFGRGSESASSLCRGTGVEGSGGPVRPAEGATGQRAGGDNEVGTTNTTHGGDSGSPQAASSPGRAGGAAASLKGRRPPRGPSGAGEALRGRSDCADMDAEGDADGYNHGPAPGRIFQFSLSASFLVRKGAE